MLFYAYIGLMVTAILLSLFNLRKGDIRLTGLAVSYACIVIGFHVVFMSWLKTQQHASFPLFVAGAQGIIAFAAYQVGCKASKVIKPLAWTAVLFNSLVYLESLYPGTFYYYTMNLLQGTEIASLIFASSIWHGIATLTIQTWKALTNKGMHYERAG